MLNKLDKSNLFRRRMFLFYLPQLGNDLLLPPGIEEWDQSFRNKGSKGLNNSSQTFCQINYLQITLCS